MLQHSTYCRAGFGGTPTADSRFAVPCPSDRNALRNPPRQHVPTVVWHFELKNMTVSFKGNIEAERVINLVKHTSKSLFLTGKAGTGKSTLLQYIIGDLDKNYVLLAPTGIAALNINGQTIHSFFGFGFRPYLPNDTDLPNLVDKIGLLKKIDLIVIDEISMVRADIMNAIDLTLKKYLSNKLPFGGKQILLVGDLLQLPPVVNNKNLEEVRILRENYSTEFFFSAKVFETYDIDVVELQKVYRQEEGEFVSILNNVRINQINNNDLLRINTRLSNNIPENGVITLTTRNVTVNSINTARLARLENKEHLFVATQTGTFANNNSSKSMPTDENLRLKEGAQIMFVKNDSERKWVNGSIGNISKIKDGKIEVKVNGSSFSVQRELWEDFEYKWNKEENRIEKEVVGTFEQYPIRLAWAITIHKSQGQTFNSAIIDLDTGAFASGQTYVALSRCTSLQGITLTRRVTTSDVKVSESAVKYLLNKGIDSLQKRDNLELSLIESIKQLENTARENASEKQRAIDNSNRANKKIKDYELEIHKVKMENEYLKKEIIRLTEITWIQKLFGAK